MYYQLQPNTTVLWSDISEYIIDRIQKENPELTVDLNRLDWQPAERFDAETLSMALRYGIPVAAGLAVAGRDLADLDHYRTMDGLVRKETGSNDPSSLPHAGLMEAMMTGWAESRRELNQQVLESLRNSAERAKAKLVRKFAGSIDPKLVEHWQSLGGFVPREA